MVTSESQNPPDVAPDDDKLSEQLARLSAEKRLQYDQQINNAAERNGEVTRDYKLGLAKTYLQGLPAKDETIQIEEHNRREQERAFERDQRNAHAGASAAADDRRGEATFQPAPEPAPSNPPHVRDGKYAELQRAHEHVAVSGSSEPTQNNSPQVLAGKYAELHRTHAQVAARGQTEPSLLPRDELEAMASHYADMRNAGVLELTPAEKREQDAQAKLQSAARDKLDRTLVSAPESERQEQRALLDYQHLAERVSDEARSLGRELRKQETPGAEFYERDARNATYTARQVHDARKHLSAGKDRTEQATRAVQQQDQQRQSEAQEAARGGMTLSSAQMANMPSNVKEAVSQKERADSDRNLVGGAHDQIIKPSASKPGNTRGGGRSR